jgi:methylthioribose-1-phosphate isomerase
VIEERPASEVTTIGQVRHVPSGVPVKNPSFDVTPAKYVSGLFTERGVASPLNEGSLGSLAATGSVG